MRDATLVVSFSAILCLFAAGFLRAQSAGPSWTKVTGAAAWAPRDSSGEVVYNGKMWLMGGWFTSDDVPPRDVWSSSNGTDWTRVTAQAGWKHSDLPTSLVFNNKMWMMAGWYGGRKPFASSSNEVWCSTNGADWQQITAKAPWCPRVGAAGLVFAGKMWVLGGLKDYYNGTDKDLLNDVWFSADGKNWTQATAQAPWAPRAYHGAIVLNNRMWVMGGGNYRPGWLGYNDVWSSSDGKNWTKATDHAPWSPRIWFSMVDYRGRMWVLGGWSDKPSKNWNDVWYSTNGNDWKELKTPEVWSPRHEHSAWVFQDKLWIAAGNPWPLVNDVWRIDIPQAWLDRQ